MSLINLKLVSSLHIRIHRNHDTSTGKEHEDHFVFWLLISLMRKLRPRELNRFGQGHTTSELNIVKIFQLCVLKANTGALVKESLKILLKSFCQLFFYQVMIITEVFDGYMGIHFTILSSFTYA